MPDLQTAGPPGHDRQKLALFEAVFEEIPDVSGHTLPDKAPRSSKPLTQPIELPHLAQALGRWLQPH